MRTSDNMDITFGCLFFFVGFITFVAAYAILLLVCALVFVWEMII